MHINEGKDKLALFSTKYNVLLTPHPSYSSAIDFFSLLHFTGGKTIEMRWWWWWRENNRNVAAVVVVEGKQ